MTNKALGITVTKSDVLWNYIGTAVSMASNFMLIPLLLLFLSSEQIGLWYVFMAISSFAQLLEFGFTATLARNIRYCLSGAQHLSKSGIDRESVEADVNWHLLRSVLGASRLIYAIIGIVGFVLIATAGSVYVYYVTGGFAVEGSFAAWVVFVISVFTNLYFLYRLTFLRGLGDIAGENKAKTIARVGQIALTAILLLAGVGLMSAAVGYLFYSVIMQALAGIYFKAHRNVQEGIASDATQVVRAEMKEVFSTVSFVAWRDGIVSVAWFGATHATSLLCSAFLGLSETATYSVMMQFAGAVHNVSSVYMRSCFPMFQSAYIRGEIKVQRETVERGMSCYVALYMAGTALVAIAVLPVLTLFKADFICDVGLYGGIALYYFLLNQHSLFCNIIVSMNEIPYFKAYLASTVAGICLSCVLCGTAGMGAWGLVLGQAIPQLLYNNWHWPKYVLDRVEVTYFEALAGGARWWLRKLRSVVSRA